ncbi:DUF4258 domain-containing protein [Nodosilinea sp. LEGE 07298]|uniref:DUF4258 domain-containing protein n=1 Tax=Nodosilinea sp. LEGE 07298 TaxID=2777970 RepID=UPI0028BE70B2|nr:DUF4258 domain-containing protein [Nodosilinea sp. LEGE 07298]
MDFTISSHAAIEINRRNIRIEDIQQVLSRPQQVIAVKPSRNIYQSIVDVDGKQYLLRLVVDKEIPPVLVTVYRTSKIQKYWR